MDTTTVMSTTANPIVLAEQLYWWIDYADGVIVLIEDYSIITKTINQTVEQLNDVKKNYSGKATIIVQPKILSTLSKRCPFGGNSLGKATVLAKY